MENAELDVRRHALMLLGSQLRELGNLKARLLGGAIGLQHSAIHFLLAAYGTEKLLELSDIEGV